MSAFADDSRVQVLLENAQRAFTAGEPGKGDLALDEAVKMAPAHPLVLNALGIRALNRGKAAEARRVLENAAARYPDRLPLWHSLALTCRALGDADAEMHALQKALALEPRFFLGLLQQATLMERLGQRKQAAAAYRAVLATAPPPSQITPAIQQALERAWNAVQAHNTELEAFLRDRTNALRTRYGDASQERFDACLAILVGKRRVYTQEPTFLHFPYLPAIEFFDRKHFPWLQTMESATPRIREELLRLLDQGSDEFIPYVARPPGAPLDQWRELNNSTRWGTYYLWRDGQRVDAHCERCPETAALLAQMPMADVPGQAPTAFFSLLRPKTRIPPHTGVTNTRVIVHLPLIVPASCGFRVGSSIREWRSGEAWVFDDTIEHEAWNDSDLPRVVLIFDTWNPFLTEAERDLVRATVEGIGAFNQDEERPAPVCR